MSTIVRRTPHKYYDKLDQSKQKEQSEWMDKQYRLRFSPLHGKIKEIRQATWEEEKTGIDKIIIFENGTTLAIEEKHRYVDFTDMLLEYVEREDGKPGWVISSQADWLAYRNWNKNILWILPMQRLRKAAIKHKETIRKYGSPIDAHFAYEDGKEHTTNNVAIPIDKLLEIMYDY